MSTLPHPLEKFLRTPMFTASTIWGLQKLGSIGMVGYHYMFLILKCFLVHPNLNEIVSIGSNLIWTGVICPNIYNISRMQIWKKLLNLPRWFQLCPSLNEAIWITQIWLKLLEPDQMFVIVYKFKWRTFKLPKLKWSCWKLPKLNSYLKLPKIERRCSTWPKFEWSYCHLARVD